MVESGGETIESAGRFEGVWGEVEEVLVVGLIFGFRNILVYLVWG